MTAFYNNKELFVLLNAICAFSAATNNGCGEVRRRATEDPQNLTSPNFPLPYPRNTTCTWWISSVYFYSDIYIEFKHLDIEDSNDCDDDSLTIYQHYKGDEFVVKICGNEAADETLKLGRDVTIVFKTNNDIERTGFVLQYYMVDDDSRERDDYYTERYSDHWFTVVVVVFVLILVALIITIVFACYFQRRQARAQKQSNIEDIQFSGYGLDDDEYKTHI
ncbi:tumor necrosis factor-inducible gene 6 protein-like isoform X1 [Ruditapes philippinarum]|uniref:tumor necrosis factor-inducible gene 6 protein-like isoform X1 n=1 Tax=Ruditapes philippinarum TaxID=129788 RepID=UPI00295AF4D1|nr:tumor necrosis factor-inducible gene 6 protein-like isoform X1 [Ruditapes philippinarum]